VFAVPRTLFDSEVGDIEGWTRQNPGSSVEIVSGDESRVS
jgi:hypothetical protein